MSGEQPSNIPSVDTSFEDIGADTGRYELKDGDKVVATREGTPVTKPNWTVGPWKAPTSRKEEALSSTPEPIPDVTEQDTTTQDSHEQLKKSGLEAPVPGTDYSTKTRTEEVVEQRRGILESLGKMFKPEASKEESKTEITNPDSAIEILNNSVKAKLKIEDNSKRNKGMNAMPTDEQMAGTKDAMASLDRTQRVVRKMEENNKRNEGMTDTAMPTDEQLAATKDAMATLKERERQIRESAEKDAGLTKDGIDKYGQIHNENVSETEEAQSTTLEDIGLVTPKPGEDGFSSNKRSPERVAEMREILDSQGKILPEESVEEIDSERSAEVARLMELNNVRNEGLTAMPTDEQLTATKDAMASLDRTQRVVRKMEENDKLNEGMMETSMPTDEQIAGTKDAMARLAQIQKEVRENISEPDSVDIEDGSKGVPSKTLEDIGLISPIPGRDFSSKKRSPERIAEMRDILDSQGKILPEERAEEIDSERSAEVARLIEANDDRNEGMMETSMPTDEQLAATRDAMASLDRTQRVVRKMEENDKLNEGMMETSMPTDEQIAGTRDAMARLAQIQEEVRENISESDVINTPEVPLGEDQRRLYDILIENGVDPDRAMRIALDFTDEAIISHLPVEEKYNDIPERPLPYPERPIPLRIPINEVPLNTEAHGDINNVGNTTVNIIGPKVAKVMRGSFAAVGAVISTVTMGNPIVGAAVGAAAARGVRGLFNLSSRVSKLGWKGAVSGIKEDVVSNVSNMAHNAKYAVENFFMARDYELRDDGSVNDLRFIANRLTMSMGFAVGIPLGAAVAIANEFPKSVVSKIVPIFIPKLSEAAVSAGLASLGPRTIVGLSELYIKHIGKSQKYEARGLKQEGYVPGTLTRDTFAAMAASAATTALIFEITGLDKKFKASMETTVPEETTSPELEQNGEVEEPVEVPKVEEPVPPVTREPIEEIPPVSVEPDLGDEILEEVVSSGKQLVDTSIGVKEYQYNMLNDGSLVIETNTSSGSSGIFQALERIKTGDQSAIIGDLNRPSDWIASQMNKIAVLGSSPDNLSRLEESVRAFAPGELADAWAGANGFTEVDEFIKFLANNPSKIRFIEGLLYE